MIRNAAIGLSPDMSIAVIGAPIYATATDTSKRDAEDDDQKQRYPERQNQQKHEHGVRPEHPSDIEGTPRHGRRSGTSGLEALLSVTAQRRREEELALLRGLSDNGAMSHTG